MRMHIAFSEARTDAVGSRRRKLVRCAITCTHAYHNKHMMHLQPHEDHHTPTLPHAHLLAHTLKHTHIRILITHTHIRFTLDT
jgi:hypothetical protein